MDNNLLGDRIGQLKRWEQTESLNEILYSTLSSLHAYATDRFDGLTQEIRDESAPNDSPPVIKVAVCTQENIDKQIFMHPVATQPPINSPNYITTVFAKCDYPTMKELMTQTFSAVLQGETGTFRTKIELKYSLKYLQKIESLYYVFNENELNWATVNGQYFYKFLDVYSKQDITQSKIDSFEIDFAQYGKYISYDKELLWNITPITVPVAVCEPRPAYNAIQYEHLLKTLPHAGDQYLVCSLGERFTAFRRGKEMYVRTYNKQHEQIVLLRIIGNEDADCPLFLPLKSNKKKSGLINDLADRRFVPTRGEAERIVHSLDGASGIRLVDIKPLPRPEKNKARYEGLDYNYFREENMIVKDRKPLLFTFETDVDKMWAFERMYYVLSELQLYFYEYLCLGDLLGARV